MQPGPLQDLDVLRRAAEVARNDACRYLHAPAGPRLPVEFHDPTELFETARLRLLDEEVRHSTGVLVRKIDPQAVLQLEEEMFLS